MVRTESGFVQSAPEVVKDALAGRVAQFIDRRIVEPDGGDFTEETVLGGHEAEFLSL